MGKSIYSKFTTWLYLLISEIPLNNNGTCAGRMNEMVLPLVFTSKMLARKLSLLAFHHIQRSFSSLEVLQSN